MRGVLVPPRGRPFFYTLRSLFYSSRLVVRYAGSAGAPTTIARSRRSAAGKRERVRAPHSPSEKYEPDRSPAASEPTEDRWPVAGDDSTATQSDQTATTSKRRRERARHGLRQVRRAIVPHAHRVELGEMIFIHGNNGSYVPVVVMQAMNAQAEQIATVANRHSPRTLHGWPARVPSGLSILPLNMYMASLSPRERAVLQLRLRAFLQQRQRQQLRTQGAVGAGAGILSIAILLRLLA